MSDLEKVLKDVGKVCEEASKRRETWRREGKYYNVFNVLKLQKKELKHSDFIADLLNPNSVHGAGDKFLRAFLTRVPAKEPISENYLSAKPEKIKLGRERVFKINGERGSIDIIAEDGENAVIIENKIKAKDQKTQLFRYYNYAKEREKKRTLRGHKLIYLTEDGHKPSEASTGGNEEVESDCICMSYKDDILPWLEKCLEIASNLHPVRELINQYIYLIKELTHMNMENDELDEVTRIAGEHADSMLALAQARIKISGMFVERFILERLKKEFDPEEFKFEFDYKSNNIILSKNDWKSASIQITTDTPKVGWSNMYIRIVPVKSGVKQKLSCLSLGPLPWSPYGYEYVQPRYWESYAEVMNGEIAEWLIKKINAIIEELGKRKIEL